MTPVQRKLVERVTAARAEMARERTAAAALRQTIAAEVEGLILGPEPLKEARGFLPPLQGLNSF